MSSVEVAPQDPQAEHAAEGQHRPHEDDREGDAPARQAVGDREAQDRQGEARPQCGVDERLDLAHPDVAPDEAVHAGQGERARLHEDDVRELLDRVAQLLSGHRELEPEQVRERERGDEDRQVQRELESSRHHRRERAFVHGFAGTG
jgi:hypothetical protein